jgi:hypothetical protein
MQNQPLVGSAFRVFLLGKEIWINVHFAVGKEKILTC